MPLPLTDEQKLTALRQNAVDAGLEADRLESEARRARRFATARYKAYEQHLQEVQRQEPA